MSLIYDINNCRKCDLWKSASRKVIGDIPLSYKARIVFIGEAPGETEDDVGRPFVGKSGQYLREQIKKHKIEKYAILNACKCRPPLNRTPTDEEIKTCRPFLKRQLKTIKPEILVLLGHSAYRAVMRTDCPSIASARPFKRYGYWIVVFPHPAAVIRNRTDYEPVWIRQMTILKKLVYEI